MGFILRIDVPRCRRIRIFDYAMGGRHTYVSRIAVLDSSSAGVHLYAKYLLGCGEGVEDEQPVGIRRGHVEMEQTEPADLRRVCYRDGIAISDSDSINNKYV